MALEASCQSKYPRQDEVQHLQPFNVMCGETRAKLEEARPRVPRYLFRAWKNRHPYLSGGFTSLNSTDGIVPLAFRAGRGHSSVYDMTREEMLDRVYKHLKFEKDFFTEFSSWTASLTFAMIFFGNDTADVYISIIDTHALRDHNEIFFVPDLAVLIGGSRKSKKRLALEKKFKAMHHEYLVHNCVYGPAHRAVPLDSYMAAGFNLERFPLPGAKVKNHTCKQISIGEVQMARTLADQYGYRFALPVTLALLSLEERDPRLFLRKDSTQLASILTGVKDILIPESWSNADTVMEDIVYFGNYQDVRQFIHLMRAVVRHKARNSGHPDISNGAAANGKDELQMPVSRDANGGSVGNSKRPPACHDLARRTQHKWFIRFNKGKAKIFQRDGQTDVQGLNISSAGRIVKIRTSRKLLSLRQRHCKAQ